MTKDNFDQVFTALQDRRPFQVYTVELHGGRRFEVDSPKAMAINHGVAVLIAPGGIPIYFDHKSVNMLIDAGANVELK